MRIFISYKRDATPDEPFALELHSVLTDAGHAVFIDRHMLVGTNWSEATDRAIASADHLIALLTQTSAGSESVLAEIERARRCQADAGKPSILPIRLAYTGQLPYSLGILLDSLQFILWRNETDTARVLKELNRAFRGHEVGTPQLEPSAHAGADGPAYAASIPLPGGTLKADDPFYIAPRPASAALAQIRDGRSAATVVIKAPRQMGKSSLLVRIVATALARGSRAVLLDLQLFGRTATDERQLYSRFAAAIAEQLDLPARSNDVWDPECSGPMNCTRFIERHVLARLDAPLLVAIDEAERLIDSPYRDDFYAMLRSWHNMRGHPVKTIWKNLSLVLVISTEPGLLIQGLQSPFNVVDPITLPPFSVDEVDQLNRLHGSPLTSTEVSALHALVGGQPYLTRKALYEVRPVHGRITPRQLFASASSDQGAFQDHLRRFLLTLEGLPELKAAFMSIMRGGHPGDIRLAYRLQSAGLVTVADGQARPSCELYAQYFQQMGV